jgi:hypothetical protein
MIDRRRLVAEPTRADVQGFIRLILAREREGGGGERERLSMFERYSEDFWLILYKYILVANLINPLPQ